MRIKKLKLKNIRSYHKQEIEFSDSSTLLAGDIGSGKTSILLAVEYALFGLQPGQKGSALLRNNHNLGEVSLEFELNGQQIVIERKLRRDGKSVSNDYSAITINGDKTEYSVTELKTKILGLLCYPPEFIKKNNLLFKYTVYTPQEQMKQIILEDPEIRLNLLGYVFGIGKYKRIRENLAILLGRLKEESKFLQGEIKTLDDDKMKFESTKKFTMLLQTQIEKKQDELGENIKKRKSIEQEVTELESRIKEKEIFEKEVEKANIQIASKKENFYSLARELASLHKSILEIPESFNENALKEAKEKLGAKKEEIEKLNSKYVELSTKINSLEQNRNSTLDRKNRVFKIDICPTCLQNVPTAHKHNILLQAEKDIGDITNNMAALEKEKSEIKVLLDKSKSDVPKLEEDKTQLEIFKTKIDYTAKSRIKAEEIRKFSEILEKDIAMLSSHMENLKENILKFSKFNNLFKLKQEELNNALHNEKQSEISLAELKKELELTNREILDIQKIIGIKEESKKKLSEMLEISDWLSGQFLNLVNFIEKNVMLKLRVEFARLFNKWFHMLAGEGFDVQLDENFTPLIIQGETEMEYSFLSGGERTAVALAYRLALNQTINSVLSNIETKDIIILDEPTEGFSETQLDKLRYVLEELDIGQLIIVSHEQKIEGFVDNVLRLKKDGDASVLENSPSSPKNLNTPQI